MIDETTQNQIDALLIESRPLIVCDVDEVVLQFVAGLEAHLDRHGHWIDPQSYALTGNVRRKSDNVAVDQAAVSALLDDFYAAGTDNLAPVPGAVEALAGLADLAQIVMLTNVPADYRETRIANLARHGISHPVVTNQGGKGPAVARLAERAAGPVVFLDDSPGHLHSVLREVPHALAVHFVAESCFLPFVDPFDEAHLYTSAWDEAHRFIAGALAAAPEKTGA